MQMYKIFFVIFDIGTFDIYSEFYYKHGGAARDFNALSKAYAGKKTFKIGKVVWDLKDNKISSSEPAGLKLKAGTAHATTTPRFVAGE